MSADLKAAMECAALTKIRINDYGNLARAFLEVTAELEQERKAREEAERGQCELCVAIGTTTDEWAFSNKRSHAAEQRAADMKARLDRVEAALVKYGRHFPLCNIITRLGVGEPKCGCDFDATMRAIAAAGGQTESTATPGTDPCCPDARKYGDVHPAPAAAPSTAAAPNVAGYCDLDGIGAWKAPSTDNAQREEAYPTDPVLQEKWKRDEALRIEGMEIAEKICRAVEVEREPVDPDEALGALSCQSDIRAEIARRQGKEGK